jgi:hypothetical protein
MRALILHPVWKTGRLLLSTSENRLDLGPGGEGLPQTASFSRSVSEVSHLDLELDLTGGTKQSRYT